ARFDDAGNLYIGGRSKQLIIRSGFNVYPPDVEAGLNSHPDGVLAAAVGRRVPGNEERVGFVQPAAGSGLTPDALRAYADPHPDGSKSPSHYIFMDSLPATASGKILKSRLAEMAAQLDD